MFVKTSELTKKYFKVADHCHVTGLYQSADGNVYNVKLHLLNRVPVVFHNLRGFDSHLLIQKLRMF